MAARLSTSAAVVDQGRTTPHASANSVRQTAMSTTYAVGPGCRSGCATTDLDPTRASAGTMLVMRLNTSLRGHIIGGLIAFVIFVVIWVATGGSVAAGLGYGLLLGVATVAVSFLITRAIVTGKQR